MKHIFLSSRIYRMHPNQYFSPKPCLLGYIIPPVIEPTCPCPQMEGHLFFWITFLSWFINQTIKQIWTYNDHKIHIQQKFPCFLTSYIFLCLHNSVLSFLLCRHNTAAHKDVISKSYLGISRRKLKSPSWDTDFLLLQIPFLKLWNTWWPTAFSKTIPILILCYVRSVSYNIPYIVMITNGPKQCVWNPSKTLAGWCWTQHFWNCVIRLLLQDF